MVRKLKRSVPQKNQLVIVKGSNSPSANRQQIGWSQLMLWGGKNQVKLRMLLSVSSFSAVDLVVVAWPWKLKPLILSYSRQSLACLRSWASASAAILIPALSQFSCDSCVYHNSQQVCTKFLTISYSVSTGGFFYHLCLSSFDLFVWF